MSQHSWRPSDGAEADLNAEHLLFTRPRWPAGSHEDEPREHRDDAIHQDRHALRILGRGISEESCDLDGRCGLDAFASGHGESPGLVGPRDAPRALGAVAANAFGGAKSFIAKLGVPNPSIPNDEKHLRGDSEHVKSMMRERK